MMSSEIWTTPGIISWTMLMLSMDGNLDTAVKNYKSHNDTFSAKMA